MRPSIPSYHLSARCYAKTLGALAFLCAALIAMPAVAQTPVVVPGAAQETRGVVGSVRDTSGIAVAHAYVSVRGSQRSTITGADGRFRLDRLASGVIYLDVRRLGFRPAAMEVDLSGDSLITVDVAMIPAPSTLAAVGVEGDPAGYSRALDYAGFYRRVQERRTGVGGGTFIPPEELEQRRPTMVTQVLRGLPGVTVARAEVRTSGGQMGYIALGRGERCPLGLVLDGQRVEYLSHQRESEITQRIKSPTPAGGGQSRAAGGDMSTTIDAMVPAHSVKAIEVYPSAASVPKEFLSFTNSSGCGLIVVWTKRD
jgi:hypothetical protein